MEDNKPLGKPDTFEWTDNDRESPAWVQKIGHGSAWPDCDDTNTTPAEPPPAPPDLAEVTKRAAVLKGEIAELEAITKRKQEELKSVSNDILRALDLMDLDSIKAHGYLFYKEEKSSVTTPKTPEQKQELFEYLKEQGIFLEVVSVNSQTLNALYKSLAEDAAADGILEFKMPGVGEPTTYTNLKLRRS